MFYQDQLSSVYSYFHFSFKSSSFFSAFCQLVLFLTLPLVWIFALLFVNNTHDPQATVAFGILFAITAIVQVCMCVCACVCACVGVRGCGVGVYEGVCVRACMCVRGCLHVCTWVCTRVYAWVPVWMCAWVCTKVCISGCVYSDGCVMPVQWISVVPHFA